jgi:hypothetical protein
MSLRFALACAIALACASGCKARAPAPTACPELDAGAPVDPALLAFLSRARSAHHAADALEAKNDLAAAESELGKLLGGALPPNRDAPEVREVLADTLARRADLASRSARFDAAEADITRGLGLVTEPSYFRGHLVEVRGLVEERRAKVLSAAGDTAGAERARDRAIAAFQEAMQIQSAVIERTAPPR